MTSSVISTLKDVIKHIAKYDGNETFKLYKNIVRNSQPFISIMKNFSKFKKKKTTVWGQVDSPESPETPEITEIIDNFIKVTKDFAKLKDTLTNYVWEKSHFKKQ